MISRGESVLVRPLTFDWVSRQLEIGERIVGVEGLRGGITAEMRRLAIGKRDGASRYLVLRSFVDSQYAEDWLSREAAALVELAGTAVPAPQLVAVDLRGTECEYPSLLMSHLPGRTVLDDDGAEIRLPLLARQLVGIHGVRPTERPRKYVALTTPDSVVTPGGANPAVWGDAIDVIREPAPPYVGRMLHRDFQPGNVLFESSTGTRVTGVVDWAGTSWGPAELDVAHCATNLALLHGPEWGLRFVAAYEEAGGVLAPSRGGRRYWLVRDALACSEEVQVVSQPWREAGRTDLTPQVVEERLSAYLTMLMNAIPS